MPTKRKIALSKMSSVTIIFFLVVGALIILQRALHLTLIKAKRSAIADSMMDVVFLHPDLGLGGAERLIVDAAVGLLKNQSVYKKVRVTIVTNFHDPKRAFPETKDGTIEVVVRAAWIPRHIRHRCLVLCATLRMIVAGITTCLLCPRTDVFIVDQVSAVLPFLKVLSPAAPILFYCHFPDQLCDPSRTTQQKRGLLHRLYRTTFDLVESWTMNVADSIVSNSEFSRNTTVATFPRLSKRIQIPRDIFYPPISIATITREPRAAAQPSGNPFQNPVETDLRSMLQSPTLAVVSINRYERKKNILLALQSFAAARQSVSPAIAANMRLFVAGGYDPRLAENVEYFEELQKAATDLGIREHTVFLRSITERQKYFLLFHASVVLYTPSGEHFGIVPIEAMSFQKCVIAVNDGGPVESIGRGDVNGFLREPNASAFGEALAMIVSKPAEWRAEIGRVALQRCHDLFTLDCFSKRLMERLLELRKSVTDKLVL